MYRGRFAPSPTGLLHFGSLVAALGSWLSARAAGGAWIVRVEDIDREREVAGSTAAILTALSAFGLESDEPIVYQSDREDAYGAVLRHLEGHGHAYRCWCSRADLEPFDGVHPADCVAHRSGRTPAWRLRVPGTTIGFKDAIQGAWTQDPQRDSGDFVIWRADGCAAYQLAVVVDDAAQRITDVVRGADLLGSTPRQILLQRLLEYPEPCYAHLPVVLGEDQLKLSKRTSALPVDPEDPLPALRAALAFLGQLHSAANNLRELLMEAQRDFDVTRIPRSNAAAIPIAAAQKDVC